MIDLIGSKQYSDESDGWVSILVRVDPFECTVDSLASNEDEVMCCFS